MKIPDSPEKRSRRSWILEIAVYSPFFLVTAVHFSDMLLFKDFFTHLVGIDMQWILITGQLYYIFFSMRLSQLIGCRRLSRVVSVASLYDSSLLRMCHVLYREDELETIYKPMYADWIIERQKSIVVNESKGLGWIDLNYSSRFAWHIWKATRLRENRRRRHERGDDLASTLPDVTGRRSG